MRKKIYLFIISSFIGFIHLNAQHHYAEWAKLIEASNTNSAINNVIEHGDSFIINGTYFLSASFNGVALPEALGSNTFIAKMDDNGDHQWISTIHGDGFASIFDIGTDADNNILLVGWTTVQDYLYVNGEIVLEGDGSWVNNSILLKLSGEDGSLIWFRNWTGEEYATLNSSRLAVDENNNIYVGGYYNAPFSIDGIEFTFDFFFGDDVFIIKFDNNGNAIWGQQWNSIAEGGWSTIRSMAVNEDALYFTFEYSMPIIVNGEPLPYSGEYYWVAVAKASKETGVIESIYPFGTEGGQLIQKIAFDNDNNLLVAGWFTAENPITIGGFTLNGYGFNDGFIFKMNSNLEVIWAKDFGGLYADRAFNVRTGPDNQVFVGGGFSSNEPLKFDGNQVLDAMDPVSLASCFLELDENGNFLQAVGIYGSMAETLISFNDAILQMANNQMYLFGVGFFVGEVEFTEGNFSANDHNTGFLFKLALPNVTSNGDLQVLDDLKLYPNPVLDYLTISATDAIKEVQVYDLKGQLLYRITENLQDVDMKHLTSGVYFVKIKSDNLQKTFKVIKN